MSHFTVCCLTNLAINIKKRKSKWGNDAFYVQLFILNPNFNIVLKKRKKIWPCHCITFQADFLFFWCCGQCRAFCVSHILLCQTACFYQKFWLKTWQFAQLNWYHTLTDIMSLESNTKDRKQKGIKIETSASVVSSMSSITCALRYYTADS